MPPNPEARLKIIAENLARAALQEATRDVQNVGRAANTAGAPFANLVRHFDQGNRTGQLFRNALQQLSFQAASIPGPVGKAGAAILGLGVSGGPILLATAALGAFALAWKKADEAGQLAAKNAESAGERMRKVFASALQGGNVEEFGERVTLFRQRLEAAREELRELEAAPLPAQRFRQEVTPQGLTVSVPLNDPVKERADALAAIGTRVNQTQALLAQAEQQARDAAEQRIAAVEREAEVLAATVRIREGAINTGRDEASTLLEIAEATARVEAATRGLDDSQTAALVNARVRVERLKEENRTLEAQRDLLVEINRINAEVTDFLQGNLSKGIAPFELSPDIPTFFSMFEKLDEQDQLVGKPRIEETRGLVRGLSKDELGTGIINQLVAQEQQRLAVLDLMNDKTFMANLAAQGLTEEFDAMVRGMNRAELKGQQLAVALVTAVSSATQAILSGGGLGAFLSGTGGILSALATKHPSLLLPGVILGGLGGIFSSADRAADRRHREEMEELRRIRENTDQRGRPQNQSLHIYIDGEEITDRVLYAVGRAERSDATPRRPRR